MKELDAKGKRAKGEEQKSAANTTGDYFTGHLTVGVAVSAEGDWSTPLFVLNGQTITDNYMAGAPKGSMFTMSQKGSITSDIFLSWLKEFASRLPKDRKHPIILLVDQHTSRYSLPVIEFCRANRILLLAFPPNCTHLLQPLDRLVFSSFKHFQRLVRYQQGLTERGVDRGNIIGVITPALLWCLRRETILGSWKLTGLSPLDRNAIPETAFALKYRKNSSVTKEQYDQMVAAYYEVVEQSGTMTPRKLLQCASLPAVPADFPSTTPTTSSTAAAATSSPFSTASPLPAPAPAAPIATCGGELNPEEQAFLVVNRPVFGIPEPASFVKKKSFGGVSIRISIQSGFLMSGNMMEEGVQKARAEKEAEEASKREKKAEREEAKRLREEEKEEKRRQREERKKAAEGKKTERKRRRLPAGKSSKPRKAQKQDSSSTAPSASRASRPRKAKSAAAGVTRAAASADAADSEEEEEEEGEGSSRSSAEDSSGESESSDDEPMPEVKQDVVVNRGDMVVCNPSPSGGPNNHRFWVAQCVATEGEEGVERGFLKLRWWTAPREFGFYKPKPVATHASSTTEPRRCVLYAFQGMGKRGKGGGRKLPENIATDLRASLSNQ